MRSSIEHACRTTPLLLLLLLPVSCPERRGTGVADSGPAEGAPRPEDRFGNDPELVADVANLESCTYREGRLDRACPQLRTLLDRLRVKGRRRENIDKLVTTLTNLLESSRDLTRLVAAESLYPFVHLPRVITALSQALRVERVDPVRATLLRQRCWKMDDQVRDQALALLGPKTPEPVRAEAATCLGRQERPSAASLQSLRRILSRDPSDRVRSNACATLGTLHDAGSVPLIVKLLDDEKVAWRCVTALAAIGTRPAYEAIRGLVSRSIVNRRIVAQSIRALTSFEDEPFFSRSEVVELLSRIVADSTLGQTPVRMASRELQRLDR